MTENNALSPEQEARWDRTWDGATELDRHRFHHQHPLDRLHGLYMIPAGGAEMLRQATAMADGSFEEWKGREGERG